MKVGRGEYEREDGRADRDERKRVAALLGDMVGVTIVHGQTERTFFLFDKEDGGAG